MNNNKIKGNRYEYHIRDLFKELGYKDCVRSAGESKNADSMGIDLVGIPYIVQCKNGYKNIKYNVVLNDVRERTKAKYPSYPVFLFHKAGRGKSDVIMTYSDWVKHFGTHDISNYMNITYSGGLIILSEGDFKKWLVKS